MLEIESIALFPWRLRLHLGLQSQTSLRLHLRNAHYFEGYAVTYVYDQVPIY